jgi:DNA-binding response OmpR family regulator
MRALIIDDEKDVRDLLSQHLRARCFAVDVAADGAEGSYYARTNEYDLIILDNMLPQKSGVEVCSDIRRTGGTMPILMLSALGETRHKVDLINAGADDYMIKPFSFDELMARTRALLRRPNRLQEEVFSVDGITIDVRNQSVRRGNNHIYLTRKEFMLFEYLLRYRGTVLSRGMIMEHVWDMTSDPFSNTIESHILSLRKKIGDTAQHRIIITVPGRGYKIEM